MDFVIAVAIGLFCLIVRCIRGAYDLWDNDVQYKTDKIRNALVATEEDRFAAKRKLQNPKARMEYLGEIQEELDYIFHDEWYDWIEPHTLWNELDDVCFGHVFRDFKYVCYSLMLAKMGKITRWNSYGIRIHKTCGKSLEESEAYIKRIALAIERLVKENNPRYSYDIEMLVSNDNYIFPRFQAVAVHMGGSRRLTV